MGCAFCVDHRPGREGAWEFPRGERLHEVREIISCGLIAISLAEVVSYASVAG